MINYLPFELWQLPIACKIVWQSFGIWFMAITMIEFAKLFVQTVTGKGD